MTTQKDNRKIVLASASPRRRFLLEQLGFEFHVNPSGVDETSIPFKSEREFAVKAALAKASDVAKKYKNALVIGADTIVCLDGEILGKPRDRDEAATMLKRLRGRDHIVITGVAVVATDSQNILLDAETTKVFFKRFTEKTLDRYLDTGDSLDKAGAYGIQGEGECLVHHIRGDYFNVMGLPLSLLLKMLSQLMETEPYHSRLPELRRPF
mgnify:CR=1 FL=1